jgi:transcriptional regulator with XRE-family HTH domain
MTISPAQSRAARALLGWSQVKLAKRAGFGESMVRDFEKGRRVPAPVSLATIRVALEDAGVEFTNGDQPGVRMKAARIKRATKAPRAAAKTKPKKR